MRYGYPDSNVFYRKLSRTHPLIVRGEGCYLFDENGKRYLDACGGAYVANLGHGVREIGDAMAAQAARVGYLNGTAFTHEPVEKLARMIAERTPGDLDYAYFLSSGSEAVEAALKLARQYWVEIGKPSKHKIIALTPSYHGNTLLALSASAREHYKVMYREWLVDVLRIPAPYPYRCGCGSCNDDCLGCTGAALESTILHYGPENIAAFIAEPVGGSSTGGSVPPADYFREVRDICDRYEVLFIADEVLTGAGRTGTFTAIEQYGVTPDILTLGKGISGGYVPLSSVVATRRVTDAIAEGSGAFLHAQTFSHHPVLCAAGIATLEYLDRHKLVERSASMGKMMHQKLAALKDLPFVGDVRGRGLLAGIEFVQDKTTKAPFPRNFKFAETFTETAQHGGLIVWPNVGGADGVSGDLVMFAPPFIVTEAQIDEMIVGFERALQSTMNRTGATFQATMA
ncbi:MAG: aspartate aminotransferase family protein [Gemmatimonadota bacterium]